METILVAKTPDIQWTAGVGGTQGNALAVRVLPAHSRAGKDLFQPAAEERQAQTWGLLAADLHLHDGSDGWVCGQHGVRPALIDSMGLEVDVPMLPNSIDWGGNLECSTHKQGRRIPGHVPQAPTPYSPGRHSRALSTCPSYLPGSCGL